jgi:hypothetical protein
MTSHEMRHKPSRRHGAQRGQQRRPDRPRHAAVNRTAAALGSAHQPGPRPPSGVGAPPLGAIGSPEKLRNAGETDRRFGAGNRGSKC